MYVSGKTLVLSEHWLASVLFHFAESESRYKTGNELWSSYCDLVLWVSEWVVTSASVRHHPPLFTIPCQTFPCVKCYCRHFLLLGWLVSWGNVWVGLYRGEMSMGNGNILWGMSGSHISVEWQTWCLWLQRLVNRLSGHGLSQASV